MPDNAYRGELTVELLGAPHRLRYSWAALVALKTEIGSEFEAVLQQAVLQTDLVSLAKFAAIGLRDAHPGVTADDIMRASPPVLLTSQAISTALHRAYYGAATYEEVAAERKANPPRRGPRMLDAIRSWLTWRMPYSLA